MNHRSYAFLLALPPRRRRELKISHCTVRRLPVPEATASASAQVRPFDWETSGDVLLVDV